jgi:hypothetical protein
MNNHYASPERTSEQDLNREINLVSSNPVMSGLLESVGGVLAVLDSNRQIVALNDSFMRMLNICDPAGLLGLRLGEALNCVYADEEPTGCGTSEYCSTCGDGGTIFRFDHPL